MLNFYPHHIFFDKVINQITHRKNKLWRFLPVSHISLSGLGGLPSKTSFKELSITVLGDVESVIGSISDDDRTVILDTAEQTIAHQFEYLGSGRVNMPTIKWHEDFKSGNKWKKGVFYLKQRTSTAKGADIKVPWELSRGHHLLWLGEAYLLTNDEKYAKEVVDEIEDWWRENPFMYSVNWTCTMDVAIRAVNWMYAVMMVLDSTSVSESFVKGLYRSLYQHGWFIFNNLERTIPYSNNHLFSDLAGLAYLGLLFKDNKKGKRWLEYAVSSLYEEIRCQVLPSGVHYERSVSYHRLMTEMVLASVYVLKRGGIAIPADIEFRAGSMLSYISSYSKPNHLSPLVEDNDDGRFLPFVRRDFRQHDYLLNPSSAECRILSLGIEPIPFNEETATKLYKDAGHAVLRHGDVYLFVTNGEQSSYEVSRQTVGTHTHNDKLSFELTLGNDDIIIDPGAYIYTPNPEKSNEFRSTAKHNTVLVDGEEQNFITPNNVFLATKNSRSTKFCILSGTSLEGEYRTFKGALTHHRLFDVKESVILLSDDLHKEGAGHNGILSFHLAPGISVKNEDGILLLKSKSYSITMSFEPKVAVEVTDDTVSPSYGVLQESKTIRAKVLFDHSVVIKTRIQWSRE